MSSKLKTLHPPGLHHRVPRAAAVPGPAARRLSAERADRVRRPGVHGPRGAGGDGARPDEEHVLGLHRVRRLQVPGQQRGPPRVEDLPRAG